MYSVIDISGIRCGSSSNRVLLASFSFTSDLAKSHAVPILVKLKILAGGVAPSSDSSKEVEIDSLKPVKVSEILAKMLNSVRSWVANFLTLVTREYWSASDSLLTRTSLSLPSAA